MTRTASTLGEPLSPPNVAVSGGTFAGAMRVLRGLMLGPKYEAIVDDIQEAFGVSRRTAERIYAGQAVNGDTTLALIFHETTGPALVKEGLARIPLERRAAVAEAIKIAAELAWLQARQEQIAKDVNA